MDKKSVAKRILREEFTHPGVASLATPLYAPRKEGKMKIGG
ncbi:hypothetical protein [Mucilaginibacter rubeus]|nr:hypothetical protein [Mucilaginibacter rubeus]